jgi:hypothetical protein
MSGDLFTLGGAGLPHITIAANMGGTGGTIPLDEISSLPPPLLRVMATPMLPIKDGKYGHSDKSS